MSDLPVVRKFMKKPVVIEAVRLGSIGDIKRVANWINSNGGTARVADEYLIIDTLEGSMEAVLGSWVIKGVKGEFYACAADIFIMTYEDA